MTVQITIRPSGHAFACEPDETVLQAAMRADLMIPYGCRNGACGTCKGRILEGTVDFGPHQASTLTEDEKRKGLALFCVARPQSDCVIEVREVRRAGDIQIKRLPCRVESIAKPAPDVAIVRLKLPATERLQYLAGRGLNLYQADRIYSEMVAYAKDPQGIFVGSEASKRALLERIWQFWGRQQ